MNIQSSPGESQSNNDPSNPQRILTRDVDAVRIPSGDTVTLTAGAEVAITQELGSSFTVATQEGLFRINGSDADALGRELKVHAVYSDEQFDEKLVWAQLKNCYDPEIPVNIVDLGLIYSVEISDAAEGKHVEIKMTLTAPGCGMGPMIASDAQQRVESTPGVVSANVEVIWEPQWSPDRITPAGRVLLGMD
jgi:probable FeS assembly SUF system protein SufT